MILFIFFVVLILFAWATLRFYLNSKRVLYLSRLEFTYNKMELCVIQEKMHVSKDLHDFFQSRKNIVANPGLADIQLILLAIFNTPAAERNAAVERYNRLVTNFPQPMKDLVDEFNTHLLGLVRISTLKASFVLFAAWAIVTSIYREGLNRLPRLWRDIGNTIKDTNFIPDNVQLAHC